MNNFKNIYKENFDYIFSYLKMLTKNISLAEELTEESFFKAYISLDSFREESNIKSWLCSIAKNCYFSYLRKNKKITEIEMSDIPDLNDTIEDYIIDKENIYVLQQILHNLNEPYKEIFSLRVFGELSYKEISNLFGKNEHWACIMYHRAKEKIMKGMNLYEN